jgi:hypothetical protein
MPSVGARITLYGSKIRDTTCAVSDRLREQHDALAEQVAHEVRAAPELVEVHPHRQVTKRHHGRVIVLEWRFSANQRAHGRLLIEHRPHVHDARDHAHLDRVVVGLVAHADVAEVRAHDVAPSALVKRVEAKRVLLEARVDRALPLGIDHPDLGGGQFDHGP